MKHLVVIMISFGFIGTYYLVSLNKENKPNNIEKVVTEDSIELKSNTSTITSFNARQRSGTSLANTEVDRATIRIQKGVIYIDKSLRFYLEYFLALQSDASKEQIRQWFVMDARSFYQPIISSYLIELFDRYNSYLKQSNIKAAKLAKEGGDYAFALDSLKETFFNEAEIEALFSAGFNQNDDAMAKSQVTLAYRRYRDSLEKNPDMDPAALRMELFGASASGRFTQLDENRRQWESRLNDYQCHAGNILKNKGLADTDKIRSIQELKERFFSGSEILRFAALEKNKLLPIPQEC